MYEEISPARGVHASPASYSSSTYISDLERFSTTTTPSSHLASQSTVDLPTRSYPRHIRQPRSISPPSAADVPALTSRPGTSTDNYSCSSRSVSSSPPTAQGTPASSISADDSYIPAIGKDDGDTCPNTWPVGGESMYRMRPTLGGRELSSYDDKPAKKMRTGGPFMGGSIISRFLNSTQPYRTRV